MGTTLTGTQINNTYDGLIKTTDNTALSATTKLISDGLGNDSCIKVGTAGTDFLGNVDFSAATVTGLPSGAAGLVSGTGTDSMKNADSLVTTPAIACGNYSIALGEQAEALGTQSTSAIVIGCSAQVGHATLCNHDGSIAIGKQSVVGNGAQDTTNSIAIGTLATVFDPNSIAIGCAASSAIPDSVAIGTGVAAQATGHVTVKALNTCVASTPSAGGILMEDAGGTARRLNITAAGALQIDSTPVGGGGGAAGLINDTAVDTLKNADSLVTIAACAKGSGAIALGNGACVGTSTTDTYYDGCGAIAIGQGAKALTTTDYSFLTNHAGIAIGNFAIQCNTGNATGISIGFCARATGGEDISMGKSSCTCSPGGIALGNSSKALSSYAINIGAAGCATQYGSIAIGHSARSTSGGFYQGAVAIGNNVQATALCAVALGVGVNANRVDTVAGNQFEAKTVGKGIVVTSPDGLTTLGIGIDNSGNIVTYTP